MLFYFFFYELSLREIVFLKNKNILFFIKIERKEPRKKKKKEEKRMAMRGLISYWSIVGTTIQSSRFEQGMNLKLIQMTEENAAAARELEGQASTMSDEMQFFTLDEVEQSPRPRKRAISSRGASKGGKRKSAAVKAQKKIAPPAMDDDDWSEF